MGRPQRQAAGLRVGTVLTMSMSNSSMPNVSGAHTGMPMPSTHNLGVGAWASEIQMLRVLRSVADLTALTMAEVSVKRRSKTLADIGAEAGVGRGSLVEAIAAALRSGEPIGGLWHQHDTAQREAVRLVDERPSSRSANKHSRSRDQEGSHEGNDSSEDDARRNDQHRDEVPRDSRGVDGDGHLDVRA